MFLFNIGFIGCHVTLLLSAHVTTASETFYFKMVEATAAFFNENVMKIKLSRIKVCKKKNLSCMYGRIDKSVPRVTVWHHSASLVMPK